MGDQVRLHLNGGAQKHGTDVHVSADSFCDRNSVIRGKSVILHATLEATHVADSHFFGGGSRLSSVIASTLAESVLLKAAINGCVLDKVVAVGGVDLTDVVAENCTLYGKWSLDGNARITCGEWYRAPRYFRITGDNGVDVGLTESTDGHGMMACWRKPLTSWVKAGHRLAKKHNWTEVQAKQAVDFFQMLLDEPLPT